MKIFSVYDSKAEAYLQPFFTNTDGAAIRMFSDVVNDPDHGFSKHPGDYTLFSLGEWDEVTGQFAIAATAYNLGVGSIHVKAVPKIVQEVYNDV